MATEKNIRRALDLLTTAPAFRVESLRDDTRAHTEDLREKIEQKNVVALGICEKVTNKKGTGKLALTFYVQKKIKLKNLKGHQVIPPTIPASISGKEAIPTDAKLFRR